MTEFSRRLAGLKLPSWMDKGDTARLLRGSVKFWTQVYGWITWPLRQFDPLTCSEALLNLIAWERDISRFDGEPLALYRKRVSFAFINAQQAGEVAGFIAIFERLGIGYVELQERQEGIDWDVITVRVTDRQIADNSDLLLEIIRKYGRTCRRYRFEVITPLTLSMHIGWYQGEYVCYPASLGDVKNESSAVYSARL
ncbi:phage tail protein [Cedecea davisae]|uniref:phage tail protein n=1 Tax=Cedecea davisae TaxID=158484 RepID=UPI00243061DD|nr:phage tail protein [Cedecea davisae]